MRFPNLFSFIFHEEEDQAKCQSAVGLPIDFTPRRVPR